MAKSNSSILKRRDGSVLKLHEAICVVLLGFPERQASTQVVSDAINKRGLYRQRDGGEVFPDQIFLRARNYPDLLHVIDREHIAMKCAGNK